MKNESINNNDLWGEDLPYSEAIISHENRILADGVTRRICYVFAKVNPGTVNILIQNKKKISDIMVYRFLNELVPDDTHDGFNWYVYKDEAPYSGNPETILAELTENLIQIHKIASQFLNS